MSSVDVLDCLGALSKVVALGGFSNRVFGQSVPSSLGDKLRLPEVFGRGCYLQAMRFNGLGDFL